ncbi:hypothetical protein L4C36_22360 [Photobacterium japonica]|uniref:hypothetical protein n=1 Tax=Photobacterium japonica TaxID=2910235 RepID=UPI003D0D6B3C
MNNRNNDKQKCSFKSAVKAACAIGLLLSLSGCEILYATTLIGLCTFQPDLTITPDTVPHAIVGQPYHTEISVSNANTPISQIVLIGDLPAGLNFTVNNDEMATIHGVATERGTFPIRIYASAYGTQCVGQEGINPYELVSMNE